MMDISIPPLSNLAGAVIIILIVSVVLVAAILLYLSRYKSIMNHTEKWASIRYKFIKDHVFIDVSPSSSREELDIALTVTRQRKAKILELISYVCPTKRYSELLTEIHDELRILLDNYNAHISLIFVAMGTEDKDTHEDDQEVTIKKY